MPGKEFAEELGPIDRVRLLPPAVRAEYPFLPRELPVPGGRMSYLDVGEGPPVLFLHGNPSWSFLWRRVIADLSGRRRCIAPDHFGMGLSDRPRPGDRPRRLVDHIGNLERLVAHLGLERFDLVVHDWGGAIGFGYARRHPEHIGRIAVTNSAAFYGPMPPRIGACRGSLGRFLVEQCNVFAGSLPVIGVTGKLAPAVRDGYRWPYRTVAARRQVADFIADIPVQPDHPTRPELEAIQASLPRWRNHPLALFWGGRDFCFDDRFLALWRERFPEAPVHRYAQAGHLVLEEAGRDELVQWLTD